MHQCSGKTCIAINNFAICLHYHYHSDLLTTTINVGNMIESLPLFEKSLFCNISKLFCFSMFSFLLFSIFSPKVEIMIICFSTFEFFKTSPVYQYSAPSCWHMIERKLKEGFLKFLNILNVQSNHVIISYCNWRDFFWQTLDQDLTGWWWSPDEWWRSPGIRRRWPKRNIEMGGKKDIGQFMGRGRHQITFDRL